MSIMKSIFRPILHYLFPSDSLTAISQLESSRLEHLDIKAKREYYTYMDKMYEVRNARLADYISKLPE